MGRPEDAGDCQPQDCQPMKDGVYLEGCGESQPDSTGVHNAVNGVRSNVLGSHLSGLSLERKVP